MLKLDKVHIGYKSCSIASDIELKAQPGQLVSLLGRNGIGKSTLLKSLSGFIPFINGQATLNGTAISNNETQAKIISTIQSSLREVPYLSVAEYILMGRAPHTNFFGKLHDEDYKKLKWSIELLNISALQKRNMEELSDGEKQKVQIARCLCQDTPIILMDEPTNYLDVPSKNEIFILLKELAKKEQKIIIMSTHELDLSLEHANHIWALGKNKYFEGSPQKVEVVDFLSKIFDMKIGKQHTN